MTDYLTIIRESRLFYDIPSGEINALLKSLGASTKSYTKNELIIESGSRVFGVRLILSGIVRAENIGAHGLQDILTLFSQGDIFGDVLMSGGALSPVSVYADCAAEILFVSYDAIMKGEGKFHAKLRENLFLEISGKYFRLHRKIRYLSARSLRTKIALFILDASSTTASSSTFDSGISRESLAALLGVNRSALSRELARMREDGIISFFKSSFKVENAEKLRDCII